MVLTLANGGVYFFQAGTEELVNEWVLTCNYWAARTSKEPLAGGVSNMEYGWNRVTDRDRSFSDSDSNKDDHSDAMSVRSGRSSRSKFGWRDGAATVRASHSPWADRIFINDWKPPLPPVVYSVHDEETQLEALQKHVASMKADLKQHTEFREPMAALVLVTPIFSCQSLICHLNSISLGRPTHQRHKVIGRKNPSICLRKP
jgi:hypothetical protein